MMKLIFIICSVLLVERSVFALKCTKPNQFLNPCPLPCIPGKQINCVDYLEDVTPACSRDYPVKGDCVPRCECKDGYLVSGDGECVRKEDCCTAPNTELVSCPDPCPISCANYETWNTYQCLNSCKTRGCVCKPGYVLSFTDGPVCIRAKDCPKKCGKNEYFDSCPPCQPGVPCVLLCQPGCFCKENFSKPTPTSKCQPIKKTCGSNEYFGIGPLQDRTCSSLNVRDTTRNKLGCFCKEGYARGVRQFCIPVEECPNSCDPGLKESFRRSVGDGTCNNPDLRNVNKVPEYGCFCPKGYLRNHKDVCVLPKDCQKCGPNQVYKKSQTDPTCNSPYKNSTNPDSFACYCKPGYVRDNNKNCILIKDCSNNCKEGEIYRLGNCDSTCADGSPIPCQIPDKFGCFCKRGYSKDKNGKCVPQEKCVSIKCSGPNEVYNACGNCDGTCDNPDPICIQACVPGCYCKDDYVRDDDGRCIPFDACDYWDPYTDDDYLFKKWAARHFKTLKSLLCWIQEKVDIKFNKHFFP